MKFQNDEVKTRFMTRITRIENKLQFIDGYLASYQHQQEEINWTDLATIAHLETILDEIGESYLLWAEEDWLDYSESDWN